jgi:hypothetical protein
MKTLRIELKIDCENKAQHEAAMAIMRTAAQHVITQARLIAGKRKPQIVLQSDDFIYGTEDIEVFQAESES